MTLKIFQLYKSIITIQYLWILTSKNPVTVRRQKWDIKVEVHHLAITAQLKWLHILEINISGTFALNYWIWLTENQVGTLFFKYTNLYVNYTIGYKNRCICKVFCKTLLKMTEINTENWNK